MSANKAVRDQVSDEEWQVRVNLAGCYRIIAMYGWDDLVFTHVSARVPGSDEHFLINAYGMLFEEMTASSLVKIDLNGEKVIDSPHMVNPAGFMIHSAVHESRPEVGCVMHTHTKAGVAVSAQKDGLLPVSQTALFPYATLGYHNYEGVALSEDEKPRLVAALGNNNALMLRNHGLLTTGATIGDAFLMMYMLETACQIQVLAQSGGGGLVQVPQPIVDGMLAQAEQVTKGLSGQLVWPGLLRKLDRIDQSYRN